MHKTINVKDGFQMVRKIGIIPNDWSVIRLDEIANVNSNILSEKTAEDYKFKYIDLSSVDNGRITFPEYKTKFGEAPSRARRLAKKGDVIIATVRPYLHGFASLHFEPENMVFSTGFAIITPNDLSDTDFIYQTLYSTSIAKQLYGYLVGTNYPAINSEDVEALQIAYPPSPNERRAIGKILSAWETAIHQQQSLIAKVSLLKKSLMQQLLSGKRRLKEFSGQLWNELALADFLIPISRAIPKPKMPFKSLGIRSHGKGTFAKPNFNPDSIALDELYQIKAGDLILNITFAWEGAVALAGEQDDGSLVSHRFPAFQFRSEIVFPEYFKHVILQKRFVYDLGVVSPGGAGRNRVLNKKDFLKIRVSIPCLEEQRRIASILNTCDHKIYLLHSQVDALKMQKKGLMQKLLTGQIRVKGD